MLLTLCAAVSPVLLPPEEAVRFEARLDLRPTGEQPAAGDRAEIRVELAWPDTVSASEAGLPAPILQLDVPACARLTEEHVTGYRALSRNEFLEAPYERLVRDTTASIPLELVAPPAEGDTVGLVLVAYVSDPAGERVRFLRRRIELPLAPGATSRAGDDLDSSWGPAATRDDDPRLRIGDRAAAFRLPRADGTTLALEDVLGSGPLVVTTYRAHW